MSTSQKGEGLSVVLGVITASGVGAVLLQALGATLLGLLGGLGGYLFAKFIKPRLDKFLTKKSKPKA